MTEDEIRANIEKAIAESKERLAALESNIKTAPPWKQYILIAILVAIIGYLAWSLFGKKSPTPDVFAPRPPLVDDGKKETGPKLVPPVKIIPKKKVRSGVKNPPPIKDSEEWVDSVDVPSAPNGAEVLTKIDTVTGEVSNDVKILPAPWFALERTNTIGAGYSVGTQGNTIPIYYRRGLVRVKDAHLIAEVGGKVSLTPAESSEAHGALLVEWRF